jgi:hypothetical protein
MTDYGTNRHLPHFWVEKSRAENRNYPYSSEISYENDGYHVARQPFFIDAAIAMVRLRIACL